jgi:hypothetical protein
MGEGSERAVIDVIDVLVNEQLDGGEVAGDHARLFPTCRCGYSWHGIADRGCPGTGAEGPMPAYLADPIPCRCNQNWHNDARWGCPGSDVEGPLDLLCVVRAWNAATEALRETFKQFSENIKTMWQSLNDIAPELQGGSRKPPRAGVRQVPPMWAVDPTRSRRKKM